MKLSTAIDYQAEFVRIVADCYSAAESYGETSDWLISELNRRVYSTTKWKRCPRNVKEYVNGYRAAVAAMYYYPANKLVWCHIWEGKAYADWNEAPEPCKQAMRENRGDSAHVWAKFLPAIRRFSTASPIA